MELGGSLWSCLTCFESCHSGPFPWHVTYLPLPPRNKRRHFDLLSEDWKLCPQKLRLAFASFHALSPFPEAVSRECPAGAGWARAGKQAGDRGDSLPEFLKVSLTQFSVWSCLLIKSVQVSVWGGAWGSLLELRCPRKALREMRLWFQSWSQAEVLTWGHTKSPCLWDNTRRIKRKAPVTLTGHPEDAPNGLGWVECPCPGLAGVGGGMQLEGGRV